MISGRKVYYLRVVWFLLCTGINIISGNDERFGGSHCIGIIQTRVDNNDGCSRVNQSGGKQADTIVISHCSGINSTSHAVLNTITTRKIIESSITTSLATVCTTNARIISVQVSSTCGGNFK